MARGNHFAVGDLVKHKDSEDMVFVVEGWLEPADEDADRLYQCSIAHRYEFEWHNCIGSDLKKAAGVSDDERPDAKDRAAIVLKRLLEIAQAGGMRQKRAELLFEEFSDHWLQDDDPDKMEVLSGALDQIEAFLRNTKAT